MPENNKLIVPPFNKKDIRDIVQKDITDGEIVLPTDEVGTKLYEHVFTYQGRDTHVISPLNTSGNTLLVFKNILNSGISFRFGSNTFLSYQSNGDPTNPSSILIRYLQTGTDNSVIYAEYSYTSFEHTVTEL